MQEMNKKLDIIEGGTLHAWGLLIYRDVNHLMTLHAALRPDFV